MIRALVLGSCMGVAILAGGIAAIVGAFGGSADAGPSTTCTWTGTTSTLFSVSTNWTAAGGATCGSFSSGVQLIFPNTTNTNQCLGIRRDFN